MQSEYKSAPGHRTRTRGARNGVRYRSAERTAGKSHDPAKTSAGSYRIAVGILLLLITYGSLYPLTWNFDRPQDFVLTGRIGISDLVGNVVLFLPLGWLLAWHYQGRERQGLYFGGWFVAALVLAGGLQWLQKYLPRTPALSDIGFNIVGYVAGWCAGSLSVRALNRLMQHHQGLHAADRFAMLMIGIWLVAELFPLIPTLGVSSVWENIKSLWQQPAWQPGRMWAHVGMTVIGLEALTHLVRSVSDGRAARPLAGLATLTMVGGKFVVIGQSPGLAVVFGIAGGALLWWCIDLARESRRLLLAALIATVTYLVYALAPYEFRAPPNPMRWLPFASSLQTTIEGVVTSVAFEALCFGAMVWSAVRRGGLLPGLTICTAVMAFGCEWAQRYLPGRTAEITSVLTALAMGWLVSALGQTGWRRMSYATPV